MRARHWASAITLAAAAGVITAFAYAGPLHHASTAPPATATCASHPRYYNWHGQMPRGITLSGLQDYLVNWSVIHMMRSQISTAAHTWHANTIRLQILQDRLVGADGQSFNRAYFYWIKTLIRYSIREHLQVVINAQTELTTGFELAESEPTLATYRFWREMTDVYGGNQHVTFDLFNEPRRIPWDVWQRDHQHLVTYVRNRGARNWLWVEGINWASTLHDAPLLHDPLHRLAYTFHHPGAPWDYQTKASPAWWDQAFGNLAACDVPVIDGEFANYRGSFYWRPHPGRAVAQYLRYLRAHHIGMLAWSLVPGSLNSGHRFASVSRFPQGDGQLVLAWFRSLDQGSR